MSTVTFSRKVKEEITNRHLQRSCCRLAAAYGIACFGRYFDQRGIVLHTEHPQVAEYALRIYRQIGVEGELVRKGTAASPVYEFAVREPSQVTRMLELFGQDPSRMLSVRINSKNICCSHCTGAFLGAAFLCAGTITDPMKEYHLEFVTGRQMLARDLEGILAEHYFHPRRTLRKGVSVVYFKSSEKIEDLLTLMGASGCSMELMSLKVYRDFRNKANRITNCETANIDKTVSATLQSQRAIQYLKDSGAWDTLPEPLRQAAELRLAWPDLSLAQLAEKAQPPISKSGLSHRLKKLEATAKALQERNQDV